MKYVFFFTGHLPLRLIITLLALIIMVSGCKPASNKQSLMQVGQVMAPGQILNLRDNSTVPVTDLMNTLAQADYVLLGELHDNPTHHQLQNKLLEWLVACGRKPAVVFEMFDQEDSGLIATTVRRHPTDPDQIARAVDWDQSGWPDWSLYRPIVKTALDTQLPIVAGNLSRSRLRHRVYRQMPVHSTESADAREIKTQGQLGLLQPLPAFHTETLAIKMRGAHGEKLPAAVIDALVLAQRMRDANLAEAMITRNLQQGVVLISGREHARLDYGVPHYLRYREPEARIVSLTFVDAHEIGAAEPPGKATDPTPPFDYLWVLPESPNQLHAKILQL